MIVVGTGIVDQQNLREVHCRILEGDGAFNTPNGQVKLRGALRTILHILFLTIQLLQLRAQIWLPHVLQQSRREPARPSDFLPHALRRRLASRLQQPVAFQRRRIGCGQQKCCSQDVRYGLAHRFTFHLSICGGSSSCITVRSIT